MNAHALPTSVQTRRELASGGIASLLLHVVAIGVIFAHLRLDFTPDPAAPKETSVEVLIVEPKPDTPPESAKEQTKEAKTVLPDMPVMPPPPPQFQEAPLAEHSSPPPNRTRQATRFRPGLDSTGPSPNPSVPAPPAPPAARAELSTGGGAGLIHSSPRGGGDGPAKQDEKDFLLGQIMPFWLLNYRDPRYHDVIFHGTFVLHSDGMLDFPYGKNDPWDPKVMIGGYDKLLGRQQEAYRVAIETFLRAVRAAQPFHLQAGIDPKSYPRSIPVYFRLGDL